MAPVLGSGERPIRAKHPQVSLRSRIIGTGSHLPEGVLTNAMLESTLETSDEWIFTRTGIRERHIAAPGEGASDVARPACERALAAAGVPPEDVDLIIVGTVTPDTIMPSTACRLQHALGCTRAGSFDIAAACTGFITSLSTADSFIRSGQARTVLVVGVDVFSRIMNYQDRSTCILFGDGAGAVVCQGFDASEIHDGAADPGILSTRLYSDGAWADALEVPGGGSREPASASSVASGRHVLHMRSGQDVFRMAVTKLSDAVLHCLADGGFQVDDLDVLVPHQANARILAAVADRLNLDPAKVASCLEWVGNTSAASIPIALDRAVRNGQIHAGSLVALAAFGAGFSWGSALLRWGTGP